MNSKCICVSISKKYSNERGKEYLVLCKRCNTWVTITIPLHIPARQWGRFARKISSDLTTGLPAFVFDPDILEKEPSDYA